MPYVTSNNLQIPMRDGFQSKAVIFKSVTNNFSKSPRPLVVMIYGGGFISGTVYQLATHSRAIAKATGATVVNISYRLAPEYKFPIAPNDVWDSVQWLVKNLSHPDIEADPFAGFIVGGQSAGANLSMTVVRRSIIEKLKPAITGVWLCVPLVMPNPRSVPCKYRHLFLAREQNQFAPFLKTADLASIEELYKPDETSPDWSIMEDPQFARWPRTYLQVAGLDPLRDDGLILEKCLVDEGVATKLDLYPGIPHILSALGTTSKQAAKANSDVVKGFMWLVSQ
jgi:acetyl esterase/lipase